MISNRSRLWWQEFSIAGVVVALASCSSGTPSTTEPVEVDEPGTVRGELAVYIADYDDGTSETSYFLRDATGAERRLRFVDPPDITPGETVKVWGKQLADALEVNTIKVASKLSPTGEIGSQSSELIGQPMKTPRIICPVQVSVNGGTPPTADASVAAWISGPKSDNAYHFENSYGQVSLTGQTYGPLSYTMTGCDTSGLATALRPMIPTADGCQHYAWVMSKVSACAWAGLGAVGTSDKPQKDTWYNGTTSCVAAIQEVGHNDGGQHSSSITCNGATIATGGITDDVSACVHSEYGDKSDTFGSGCRHMNAWQKLYQKWWGGAPQGGPAGSCNAVTLSSQGTFTFNLYPTEIPCNGVQAIEIRFPNGKTRAWQGVQLSSWYLEFRAPLGAFDGSPAITPQVQAHLGVVPVLPTQANPRGVHTWIPNIGNNNMALTAGTTFSDPAGGMKVSIDSIDMTKAVVTITLDAAAYPTTTGPTCLDGMNSPFQTPGPSDCSSAPPLPPDGGVTTGTTGGTGGTGGRGGAGGGGGRGGAGGNAGSSVATGGAGGNGQAGNGQAGSGMAGSGQAGSGQAGSGQAGSGQAGSGPMGSGGAAGSTTSSGTTGRQGGGGDDSGLTGGCACRIETTQSHRSPGALLALALGSLFASRRRKRKVD
jgi:MYXO-CTERM domain-containing protein